MKQGVPLRFCPHKAEFICISAICVFLLLLSPWLAFLAGPVIYIAFLPLLIIMAFLEYYEFLHFALQITINEQRKLDRQVDGFSKRLPFARHQSQSIYVTHPTDAVLRGTEKTAPKILPFRQNTPLH